MISETMQKRQYIQDAVKVFLLLFFFFLGGGVKNRWRAHYL